MDELSKDHRICFNCKSSKTCMLDGKYPIWHRNDYPKGTWLCAKCYASRNYKRKFATRKDAYRYLSKKMRGSGNPFFGKPHTEETKNRISKAKTGVPLPDQVRIKMMGRKLSLETRAKLSAAFKGRPSPMKGRHHSIESKVMLSIANTGKSHTEETKRKLSEAKRGEKNPCFGKHLSDETRKKISEAIRGEKNYFFGEHHSEATKIKISEKNKGRPAWNKGLHWSAEIKRKMSTAHIGIYPSKETIYKRSLALTGLKHRPLSAEARGNMGRAHIGKKLSDETRAKMRRCTLNEKAFETITDQSAYWVGMLIADGNVSIKNGLSIVALHLQDVDKDHIDKFRDFVGSSHKLGRYINKKTGRIYYSILFSSERMANDLAKYGVVPRKCFIAKIKGGIENSRDLWRGIVDGDGYMGIYHKKTLAGTTRIEPLISLTGSLHVCLQFKAFLENTLGLSMPNVYPAKNSYTFPISGHRAVRAIKLLYANYTVALDRKSAIAKEIMKSFEVPSTYGKEKLPKSFEEMQRHGVS